MLARNLAMWLLTTLSGVRIPPEEPFQSSIEANFVNFTSTQLSALLERAVKESAADKHSFLSALLSSDVLVPTLKTQTITTLGHKKPAPVVGKTSAADYGISTISFEGHTTVPCFTDEVSFDLWISRKEWMGAVEKLSFRLLLNKVGASEWIILNPCSDFSKDFSPWEIDLLRKGIDALQEIVEGDEEAQHDYLEVSRVAHDQFSDVLSALSLACESYPEVSQAILAQASNTSQTDSFLTGNITHNDNSMLDNYQLLVALELVPCSDEKRNLIVSDVRNILEGITGTDQFGQPPIVIRLLTPNSPDHALFADITPCYIRSYELTEHLALGSTTPYSLTRLKRLASSIAEICSKPRTARHHVADIKRWINKN